ncbi:MAG: ABC transporter substrate-binding protein [Eubacteriales bacterium]
MKNKPFVRILALTLAVLMCAGLAACTGGQPAATTAAATIAATTAATAAATTAAPSTTTAATIPVMTTTATSATTAAPVPDTPLVIACEFLSQKFSPFYADSSYDADVVAMTQLALMTTDRTGGIIYNGIEGEVHPYNGTDYIYYGPADLSVSYNEAADITTYTAKLREDLVFSDGVPVTADDLIFTYYAFLDTSYVGAATLGSYPIVGLQNYIYNNSKAEGIEISDEEIAAALAEPPKALEKQMTDFVESILLSEAEWVRSIYNDPAYAKYTEAYPVAKDLFYYLYGTDNSYDSSKVKSEEDVVAKVIGEYGYDYKTLALNYTGDETYFDADINAMARAYLIELKLDELGGEEVANIAGIRKLDDYTVEIQLEGFSAPAVYSVFGVQIAPLHYYGDPALYDYENNLFGFTRGDLSDVAAKTTHPLGAGPYRFIEYTDQVVYFEANEHYYKGEPKTRYVQFIETAAKDVISGIAQGTVDAGEIPGSANDFSAIRGYNTDGLLQGDIISVSSVDYLGYGYIGLNADTMNVGAEPASDASKNLRRAFATVLAAYRIVCIESYFGDAASVIQYPISSTSWAAPQKSDADYQEAFSTDVDGNPLYTDDMDENARYAAALDAAVGFLKAAGYTFDDATGIFTEAPDGASLTYEIYVPGGGAGEHPGFMAASNARDALASVGIELNIIDPINPNEMLDELYAGTQNMWCSAWEATIDPDMYQVYHSSGIAGRGGSDSNFFHIDDPVLDQLILDARLSSDQSYRKSVYRDALGIIADWAVEIPMYQRQNIIAFSSIRVNMDTVTPDITTYWKWMQDIELLEMN